jgi:rhodanese-related sulfurtransferase
MPDPEIKDIRPDEAMDLLRQDPKAIILDVRTTIEYQYVGHPLGAVHIPWMEAPAWQVDPTFVEKVRNALRERNEEPVEQTLIMAICRSGTRSRLAAEELSRHGFLHVFNIGEGFEGPLDADKHRNTVGGWRYRGLPWEQS